MAAPIGEIRYSTNYFGNDGTLLIPGEWDGPMAFMPIRHREDGYSIIGRPVEGEYDKEENIKTINTTKKARTGVAKYNEGVKFDLVKTEALPSSLPLHEPAGALCFEFQKRPADNLPPVEEFVQYRRCLATESRSSGGLRRRNSSGCGARSRTSRSIHRRSGTGPPSWVHRELKRSLPKTSRLQCRLHSSRWSS